MVLWEDIIAQFISQAPWSLAILVVLILAYTRLRDEFRGDLFKLREEFGGRMSRLRDELRDEFRGDVLKLREEFGGGMSKLRDELRGEMLRLREEFRGEIFKLREEFRSETFRLRDEFKSEVSKLGEDVGRGIESLDRQFTGLVAVFISKGFISREELELIRSLSRIPTSESRYYTKAEEELRRLWSKDIDEYTEEDVEKILEIALKIKAEGEARKRRDLIEAYYFIGGFAELLRVYIMVKKAEKAKAEAGGGGVQ